MCIPYSILHISTMNFPIFNTIKYAYPYVNNETFKFIKTLEYTVEYKFKPYTEEVIYNFYYNILIDKLTNFNNSLFITTNNGSNGDINYIPFEGNNKGEKKSINCKQIILDYLNSNNWCLLLTVAVLKSLSHQYKPFHCQLKLLRLNILRFF